MNIHILGIGGTFMAGLAVLAKSLGYRVTGQDAKVYPPMSILLENERISWVEGYDALHCSDQVDVVIIGNALSRGNPAVEAVLSKGLYYTSGPQWLADYVCRGRWVLAVAGTHGKTTTAAMLATILDKAGFDPGFLIGGIPGNYPTSARLGSSRYFVIEADEYDTAFFDKRSKFIHYRPKTLVINNLEYDHADIFEDLAAIQKQFHHLIKTVPQDGLILIPDEDPSIRAVLRGGVWSKVQTMGIGQGDWMAQCLASDGSRFAVSHRGVPIGRIEWSLIGEHNVKNALSAIAAASHVGVEPTVAFQALTDFKTVKRRLEVVGCENGIAVYDDFAHHPTAIKATLAALRSKNPSARIIAVVECASNSMKMGKHADALLDAFSAADKVLIQKSREAAWDMDALTKKIKNAVLFQSTSDIIAYLAGHAIPGDHVVVMSNKAFEGIHQKILAVLKDTAGVH